MIVGKLGTEEHTPFVGKHHVVQHGDWQFAVWFGIGDKGRSGGILPTRRSLKTLQSGPDSSKLVGWQNAGWRYTSGSYQIEHTGSPAGLDPFGKWLSRFHLVSDFDVLSFLGLACCNSEVPKLSGHSRCAASLVGKFRPLPTRHK